MQTLPPGLASHLAGDVTTLTVCWLVEKLNGDVIRGTAHQTDITITTGTYAGTYKARTAVFATDNRNTSDGAVSNLDVDGAFRVDATIDDISVTDIEAGLYDQARAVLLLVNWADPDSGQKVLRAGTLGEFYRDSSGRYRSEVRGLTQALSQQIVRTYSERCDVKIFGDERCKFDVAAATRTGTVTAVTNRKRFDVSLDAGAQPPSPVYFVGGRLKFTSGALDGVIREVRGCRVNEANDAAEIALWEEAPTDVEVGMTIELPPGCDRTADTCRLIHQNFVNFRGHGLFATGKDALMRGPTDPVQRINVPGKLLTLEQLQAILDSFGSQTDVFDLFDQ